MPKVEGFDESRRMKTTCTGCTAIVSYTENEVTKTSVRDYGGTSDSYHYIHCPNCKKAIEVTSRYRGLLW